MTECETPTQAHGENISLLRFCGPRYWLTWLFVLWLRLTAALPWRVGIRLHKILGRAAGGLLPARRAIIRRNLEICFPELDERALVELTKRHFESLGAFFAETAVSWFGSPERVARLFHVEGSEHLQTALAGGRGVLLFSGHFTPLEICVPVIKPMVPLYAFVFRGRRNLLLNEFQRRGRMRTAHVSLVNDDVRAMLRLLAKNAAIWYAPDQARIDSGELIPFFGVPAMTSTATSRLARVSGAAVVPLFFRRLADDSGYLLRFGPLLDNFPSADATADTVRLTAVLEGFIRESPDQYFWTHRRFKNRRGMSDVYDEQRP